jgi:tRNA threonylcarbamoyladenosine biosynthesis protein TsaB
VSRSSAVGSAARSPVVAVTGLGDRLAGGAPVLALDAATPAASVAVLRGDRVLAERTAAMRPGADDALMPAVDAALLAAGLRPGDLAAVVCGAGPGGFTSLRIAGALAKGLAHATGCALVAVPSLALAAARAAADGPPGVRRWIVTLDALRGERYAAAVGSARAGDVVRITDYRYLGVHPADRAATADGGRAPDAAVRPGASGPDPVHVDAHATPPLAAGVRAFALALARGGSGEGADAGAMMLGAVDLHAWEPEYGRQAEAQARWESAHGRPLAAALAPTAAVAGPAGDA